METTLENLVDLAVEGDKDALEDLIRCIQDRIYQMALRMLYHPSDAEDAMQEILIKVITHLNSFRHESAFFTWVYRIAANHLLNTRKSLAERLERTFDQCAEEIVDQTAVLDWREKYTEAEQGLLVEEVRLSCIQALLLCLDRNHRLAYILGEVFEIQSQQGGYILNISRAAFRKRLSRARTRLRDFMKEHCGLIKPENKCHCEQQVGHGMKTGWINQNRLLFAGKPCRALHDAEALDRLRELQELDRVAALFKSHPEYAAPVTFVEHLKSLIESEKAPILMT